jgi:deazaflavin-dependent oxidoreductase (nitroreductase family)
VRGPRSTTVSDTRAATESGTSRPGDSTRHLVVNCVVDQALGAVAASPYLRLHQLVYRLSRGYVGRHVGGRPALLLTTRGRRTGLDRTVALIYARRDEDLIVVASNGGSDRHPAWYGNATADPQVHVQVGRKRTAATARIAVGDERDDLWALVNRKNRGLAALIHPGAKGRYDMYQRHTRRVVPVVVLTP